MTDARTLAALNNAGWCDAVVRSHGIDTELDHELWIARTRTPPFYPDAVTLAPSPPVSHLLARVDASAGCSIKDSFATLDFAPLGFRVLLDGQWIARRLDVPAPVAGPSWARVRDASELAAWETAWSGGAGSRGLFRADLLAEGAIDILAAWEADRIVAGAVFCRSAGVVGISNVFSLPGFQHAAWAGCLARASALVPGATAVGYESGGDLVVALEHGFSAVGPLRVWLRD